MRDDKMARSASGDCAILSCDRSATRSVNSRWRPTLLLVLAMAPLLVTADGMCTNICNEEAEANRPSWEMIMYKDKCNDGGADVSIYDITHNYGAVCDLGTDCDDCGTRPYPPPSVPLPPGYPPPPIWPPITNPYTPLCTNGCSYSTEDPGYYASDGSCYDGGLGAESDSCDYGDDCEDCGERPFPMYKAFHERIWVDRLGYRAMSCSEDQQRLEITSADECWKAAFWIAQNLAGTLALPYYSGQPFDATIPPVDDGLSGSTTYPRGCYAHTSGDTGFGTILPSRCSNSITTWTTRAGASPASLASLGPPW